jgi:8-oxo-dGTP pyrophosphatase MutT (NUDIX family)/phosphohistidine phosphatase SixA
MSIWMRTGHPPGIDVVAAGAVLWRPSGANGTEAALVHRPRYDDWSLPKGKLNAGEVVPAAAVREVAEETGHHAALGAALGESRYRVAQGEKVVYYWSARAEDGEFTPNDEVDELRWVPASDAAELLSYQRDVEVLERFRRLDPPPAPLLLVRHAKAGSRQEWTGDDDLRPLTEKGQAQAAELTGLLRLFGPTRLHAAPPLRCPQSIQPLADELGLPIATEPTLGEHGYEQDPDAGLARLLELAAGPGVPVVCSQGGVIPDLIRKLTGHQQPLARKASTWVLGITDRGVVSADYYPEPPL